MRAELSKYLVRHYPLAFLGTLSSRVVGLPEFWNDAPWRRKKTVVKVLQSLAEQHKEAYIASLNAEKLQLSIEVAHLKEEKAALERRVAKLEEQNKHLWGRLLHERSLHNDEAALRRLDQELDTTAKKLALL